MVVTRHPRVETLGYYWSRICAPKGRTTSALIIAQDFSPGWPCVQASDKEVAQDFSPGWPCVQVLGSRQKKRRPKGRLFLLLGQAFAFVFLQEDFAQTDGFWGDLHVFVALDVFEGFFQTEGDGGNDAHLVVGAGGTHVGQFLTLGNVDHEVAIAVVFADDLTHVHLFLGRDEKFAAILQLINGVSEGGAGFHADEGAVLAFFDGAAPGLKFDEAMGHNGFPGIGGTDHVMQTNDSPLRNDELEVYSLALALHAPEFALALGHQFNGLSGCFIGQVDGKLFNGLVLFTGYFLNDYTGLTHLQFVAFATHGFDEHRQVQNAAAVNVPGIGRVGGLYTKSQVFFQFLIEAVLDVARGNQFTFLTEEG